MSELRLSALEARVLGALIEKEIATPEYYPLSINALVNACNQKSNRDPWMRTDEAAVRLALRGLGDKGLAGGAHGAEQRVAKFEHRLGDRWNLTRPQMALLCELLLRGPQTPGELRARAERMYAFGDLDQLQAALQRMSEHDPPLVQPLPRQPGTKEIRYAHRLAGEVELPPPEARQPVLALEDDRLDRLEREVAALRAEVRELREQLPPRE